MKRLQVMIATLAIHILCILPLAVGAELYPASSSAAAQRSSPQVIIQSIEPCKRPATSTEFRCREAFQCLMFNGKAEWPGDCVAGNAELRAVLELIGSGHFTRGDAEVFRPLVDNLTQSVPVMVNL